MRGYFLCAFVSCAIGIFLPGAAERLHAAFQPPPIVIPKTDLTKMCFMYFVLTVEKKSFAPLPWWETNCKVLY